MEAVRGVYAIVDDQFPDPLGVAGKLLAGGCRLIQLRAKKISTGGLVKLARMIGSECRRYNATFIVNDRVDIAMAAQADGVHLGQDDLPLKSARRIVGGEKIIGISTHSFEEAILAQKEGADYIGFGPIFRTGTKENVEAPRGLATFSEIARRIRVPVVAIGGIKKDNIIEVFEAGADAAALISEIAKSEDVTMTASQLIEMVEGVDGYS